MPISAEPFGTLKTTIVRGRSMAYIDEGEGEAIVFQHGNPTSSYLWRNIMPHCQGLGRRLIACDLIGMGGSDKLRDSGPDRYTYAEQRDYLFDLWDKLALGEPDRARPARLGIGSWLRLGDPASRTHRRHLLHGSARHAVHAGRVARVPARAPLRDMCGPAGETLVLEQNMFVEQYLPNLIARTLSEAEMDAYRAPFRDPGEGRRPTLTWPRQIPVEESRPMSRR